MEKVLLDPIFMILKFENVVKFQQKRSNVSEKFTFQNKSRLLINRYVYVCEKFLKQNTNPHIQYENK